MNDYVKYFWETITINSQISHVSTRLKLTLYEVEVRLTSRKNPVIQQLLLATLCILCTYKNATKKKRNKGYKKGAKAPEQQQINLGLHC